MIDFDIENLTSAVTSIFQNIVDFLVVVSPVLVLLLCGWYAVHVVRHLLKGGDQKLNTNIPHESFLESRGKEEKTVFDRNRPGAARFWSDNGILRGD